MSLAEQKCFMEKNNRRKYKLKSIPNVNMINISENERVYIVCTIVHSTVDKIKILNQNNKKSFFSNVNSKG